jgi:hypothetical protein
MRIQGRNEKVPGVPDCAKVAGGDETRRAD